MKTYGIDYEAELMTEIAAELASILIDNGVDEDEAANRVRIMPSNLDTIPATGAWLAISPTSFYQPRQDASYLREVEEEEATVIYRRVSGYREATVNVSVYREPDCQTWVSWLRAGLRSYDPLVLNRQTVTRGFVGTAVAVSSNVDALTPSATSYEVRRAFTLSVTVQMVEDYAVEPLETFSVTSEFGDMTTTTEISLE
jgi:hypothetical protein